MEPVTHFMTGAVLSRAGFNRKAAYATLAMTLAAEAPDLDVLWSIKGPVATFEHHRGWTHALIGVPIEAAVVTGVIWLGHHIFARRRAADVGSRNPGAPVRWGLLYWLSAIALLSHILLDWTNNYGVRPFFPFNPKWYSGSIVLIVEPVMFLMLLGALIAPELFGLIGSEVGARRPRYRGQGWAITALLGVVALWSLRFFERQKAMDLVQQSGLQQAQILRVTADPFPINPFRWQAVMETPLLYQVARVDTLSGDVSSSPQADVFYKPPSTLASLAAKRSWLGHVYLDWAQFPVVNDLGEMPDGLSTVTFRDLRFVYGTPVFGRESTPLEGVVTVNDDRRIVEMRMDGHTQR
ncbi:MAG TPA: metal-dependent hydrolase [Edaphobacter sp.]|nr:metal-dependent hydrolase [Edaphobacter sp.]